MKLGHRTHQLLRYSMECSQRAAAADEQLQTGTAVLDSTDEACVSNNGIGNELHHPT
jgi:hypothetical protein